MESRRSLLDYFRIIAFLEGVSFLVLLGIAMPLKYWLGVPLAVRVVGMIHGILFLLYAGAVAEALGTKRWAFRKSFWAMVASVLPFGTFVFDARYRSEAPPT